MSHTTTQSSSPLHSPIYSPISPLCSHSLSSPTPFRHSSPTPY
ncbi:22752_t:CDS:1, partial [Rhizophagus irregularis]